MTNEQIYTPKFIKIRDKRQLTKENLNLAINLNKNYDKILKFNNPNYIANNLHVELNSIENTVAPPKIVKYRKNFQPYFNNEIKQQMEHTKFLLNQAIITYEFEHWVE